MKKLFLLILFLLILFPLSALAQTPPTLEPGVEVSDTLDPENFAQNYVFVGSTDDAVTLDAVTANPDLSIMLLLTSPSGEIVAQDIDLTSPDEALIGDFSLPEDGQYVVTIMRGEGASGEATGTYSLTLSGELTPPVAEVVATPNTSTPDTIPDATTTTPAGNSIILAEGGITIELGWAAAMNFDLEVRDPVGGAVFSGNLTVPSGGTLAGDTNATCANATADQPQETTSWVTGSVPTGSYEIIIYYTDGCSIGGPQQFNLTVQVDGEDPLSIAGTLNPNQSYLAALDIDPSGTWTLFNGGVNAGLDISLLSTQIGAAQPFTGVQTTGILNRQTPAIAYTLEGIQGDSISVSMDATSGNLDPFLILLDPNAAELARNDDRAEGNTNSTISYTLPQNGIYTFVATRYGQTIGGTEGDFTLTLSLTLANTVPATGNDTVAGSNTLTGTDTTAGATTTTGTDTTAGTNTTSTTLRPDGLPAGSVEVILTWATTADVQLLVRDPAGASVYDDSLTVQSGGIQESGGNARCEVGSTTPVSYIYWPASRLPRGIYEVEVWYQNNCGDTAPVTFNLAVNVQGQQIINTTQPISLNDKFGITFEIDQEGKASAFEGGFFDMSDASSINFFSLLTSAEPIEYGDTAPGEITGQERFKIYSFQGTNGDRIRVAMQRTGGTLDTAVFLISEQGLQLANNDDIINAVTGERDTNSLIDSYTLPATGTYYILATHYGLQFGGTTGTFNLTLFELAPQ